ncbi:ImmA/IrrE family metallo-endopeptidase [Acetobacter persici]|uniref:ImmA/IrrE family metallo-endopeptidase n=1 Tax=Acetobacter persici TaxID=1076596 RepID=UPI001BAB36A8|nr:ImmA/IrrE family metallo-endopeptidase [Acetobacter persici]MBS1015692.1 ImmA/IrrE family metallo-endopeptidase [Acetobacter persici]
MKKANLLAAEGRAEQWLKENCFVSAPIDPLKIAEILDISVLAKDDSEPGVSGMLLRHGDTFGIVYATHIDNLGFQRFSIAHELGHYLLPGHPDHLFGKGNAQHISHAGSISIDPYEQEADQFASALLMPTQIIKSILRRTDEGMESVITIAHTCEVSIEAAAIRYIHKTEVPAAAVISTNGRIDYAFLSKEMLEFSDLAWPRKGESVPASTLTHSFRKNQDAVRSSRRETDEIELQAWLGGRKSIAATEEVLGLGRYGKVLTIVTADIPDENDETEIEDSWRPRFKR